MVVVHGVADMDRDLDLDLGMARRPFSDGSSSSAIEGRHLWDFDSCCYGRHPDVRLSAIGSLVPQKRQHHQEQQQRHVLGLYSPCLIIVINQYRYSRYPSTGLSSGWLVSLAALC
uniref:HDC07110 n=1 Tax=Drosophila melanogaster TaxID=7227 RepID=Q6IG69_DROME|nr:TPA_inf: HDC07110 [Drosophila melanogaster]